MKFILFLLLFGLFFEAGLFSSYTIVTAKPPDVGTLINMQTSKLAAIWDSISFGSDGNSTNTLKILNGDPVIQTLKNKTGLSGVNLETMTATSDDDMSKKEIAVTINAEGYKDTQSGGITKTGNTTGGQIVITASEKYSLTATAMAKKKAKGVEIDVNTIKVTSLKKVYQ